MKPLDYKFAPEIVQDGKPHLAVDKGNGFFIPIVQETATHGGTPLWYVSDPTSAEGVVPMYLKSLDKKKMVLRCACGKAGCSLKWEFKIKHVGRHPLPDKVVTK